MSILANKGNLTIISHENYINSLYSKVENTIYTINNALFAIETPFNPCKHKKIKSGESIGNEEKTSFKAIKSDIKLVQEYYYSNKIIISLILAKAHAGLNKFNTIEDIITNISNTGDQSLEGGIEELSEIGCKCHQIHSSERKRNLEGILLHEKQTKNQKAIETSNELLQQSRNFNQPFESFCGSNNSNEAIIRKFKGSEILFPPNSTFYCKSLDESLTFSERFNIIVMDPPWWNKAIRRKNMKHNGGYPMMFNNDVMELPISSWLSDGGVVVVWCTNSPTHLQAVEDFFHAWGLSLCAKWYWLKVTQTGEPITPFGDPPRKQPFEQIVIGVKGSNCTWSSTNGKLIVSVPSAVHSHKPPLVNILKDIIPHEENIKGLELFARYLLPGWTSVGIEVLMLQNISFYTKDDTNLT